MAIETLGAALRHINRLFVEGTVTGLSDAQLLDRFLATRDGEAFEVLVARHGPMVLSVCRGVLRDPSDAEDAFQATFLVLVKKGRTIRGRDNLGGWLHQVAYRVAIQANAAAARRRVQERRAGEMAAMTSSHDPGSPDELLPALHEEIARLPEKIRLAVVLCDLQGMPQAQAAESLRWSERTCDAGWPRGAAAQGPAGPPRAGMGRGGHDGRAPPRGGDRHPAGLARGDRPGGSGPPQSDSGRRGRLGGGAVLDPEVFKTMLLQKLQWHRRPCWRRSDGVGGVGRLDLAGR